MVIGPTPPGTGVIQPATSLTASKSTSPTRPSSVRLVPTSMTAAPGLTMSGVTNFGLPIAAIRISACLVIDGRSLVRLWQSVTVAFAPLFAWESMIDSGRPTIWLRPSTTACCPSTGTPLRWSICSTPCGVQGRNRGWPCTSSPTFSGWNASTSLAGFTALSTRSALICGGSGSWIRMPWTASSRLSLATRPSSSSWVVSAGRRCRSLSMPTTSHALRLLRT